MISVHFCYKLSLHYPCVLRLKFFIFKLMEHQILHAWKINEWRKMWFKWWVLNLGKDTKLSKIILDNHIHNDTRMFILLCLMILFVHHLLTTMGFGCQGFCFSSNFNKRLVPWSSSCVCSTKWMLVQFWVTIILNLSPRFNIPNWNLLTLVKTWV